MKANEIRIGCNFQLENGVLGGGIATIKNKYDLDVAFDLLESNLIKPIPLTEEWLLRMGFQLCNNYYHTYFDTYRAEIRVKQNGNGFAIRLKRNNSMMWLCNVEYVHQLQNLYFALTGEELTIKTE